MPEWSKGADSRSAGETRVSSNLTKDNIVSFFFIFHIDNERKMVYS